jgi:hypothetical protein
VVFKAAKADRYADIIAALALLCGAPMPLVENLLQSEHREAWVIPCRVAGLDWPTVRVILSCRAMGRTMTDQTLDAARADYYKLSQASAGRVLRFWQVRQSASKDAGPVKISSPAAEARMPHWSKPADAPRISQEEAPLYLPRSKNSSRRRFASGKLPDRRHFRHRRAARDQESRSSAGPIRVTAFLRWALASSMLGCLAIGNGDRHRIRS